MQNPKVTGFFHYGVAVDNLDSVCAFFGENLGMKLVAEREIRAAYIEDLVNSNGVWAEVRMFEIDANSYLEVLKWHGTNVDQRHEQGKITSLGAQHLCVFVENIDELLVELSRIPIVEIISKEVTLITAGPNTGAKVIFVCVDNLLYLELFQKPVN